jgi:50S ribosomal protein L16 3-hydroxylase
MNSHLPTNLILNPDFDTAIFMRDIWRKTPFIIRNAFDFSKEVGGAPITTAEIYALAINPEQTARLISHKTVNNAVKWSLKHSPLNDLPKQNTPNWTVLVQNVELSSNAAHQLLRQFSFTRFAELDDLMVSYATTGGGVGAHIDSYDVFLLQGQGQRRWRISQQIDLSLVPKLPLKILKNFVAQEEWVLNPGDMLYLPPNIAHEGIALSDDCLTYSIGYRSPRLHDALDDLLGMLNNEEGDDDSPQLILNAVTPNIQSAQLTDSDIHCYRHAINNWLNDFVLEEHLGCLLTRSNRDHAVATPRANINLKINLNLSAGTRMLYSPKFIFIEGFAFAAAGLDWNILSSLANKRYLTTDELTQLSKDALDIVQDWLQEGWCTQK